MQNDAATIPNYVELTSDVVSAYVSSNSVSRTDLPGLIGTVHAALSGTSTPAQPNQELTPPVPINKTIRPDYIISLEDGRRYKSMKRHLTGRGLTPEQYRTKWGLRPDYPMVAASYSKARSELAKALGLGQKLLGGSAKPKRVDGTSREYAALHLLFSPTQCESGRGHRPTAHVAPHRPSHSEARRVLGYGAYGHSRHVAIKTAS